MTPDLEAIRKRNFPWESGLPTTDETDSLKLLGALSDLHTLLVEVERLRPFADPIRLRIFGDEKYRAGYQSAKENHICCCCGDCA